MLRRFAFAAFAALLAVQYLHAHRAAAAPPTDTTVGSITLEEFLAGKSNVPVPPTPAFADRTPSLYVIIAESGRGDTVFRIDCTTDATVGSALRNTTYPHPIDFATVQIAVHRPRHHVYENLSIKAEQEILRVQWDAKAGQPTENTNHRLQPGDRLIVTLPKSDGDAFTPVPVAAGGYYTPAAPIDPAAPNPAVYAQPYTPDAKPLVHYSAIPAPVPSPFTGNPTAAVAQTPARVSPLLDAEPMPANPAQVGFDIVVVEDLNDSFAEFEQLRTQMPFMLTDTATMRGTLRILEKHKLVRRIAAPKLMVVAGQEATFQVGSESPVDEQPWQGLKATVGAQQLGGGLAVEFGFKNTAGRQTNEVQTSLIVPHGQTVVMKTAGQLLKAATGDDAAQQKVDHAVYVVLTPEIVK